MTAPTDAQLATGYEPESPFLQDGMARAGIITPATLPRPFAAVSETPFLSEYDGQTSRPITPQAAAFASFLAELNDAEFEDAVTDLANEAAALAEERFSFEGDPSEARREAEHGLREYFAPLVRESEGMLDSLLRGIGETDLGTMAEGELEAFLDRFAPAETALPPTFNNFLGKLWKKAKKAVKGAVRLAKKGVALAAKLNPVLLILGKLKKLVRPLLERVLRVAIGKLPQALRPVATQLARRFLGISGAVVPTPSVPPTAPAPAQVTDTWTDAPVSDAQPADAPFEPDALPTGLDPEPVTDDGSTGAAASADPADIAEELDTELAGYAVEGEDFERLAELERFAAEQDNEGGALGELERCRAAFARDIVRLRPGEDPAPVVEQFLPAVLGALRLGIRVVGRPRVVRVLSRLVSRLIARYVGPQQATALSRALVDAGLRLVSLESPEQPAQEAGQTLAATLEDTMARVTESAPETAWQSETVLEGYVTDAFARAASAHFPDAAIRPSLHEAAEFSGAWIPLPPGPRKHYKKYSRVLDVTIPPQVAGALRTFGQVPLGSILRDQLGLRGQNDRPLRARVHLFEATAGSTLSDIASHEREVRGLGTHRRAAWSQIHPLTPDAAGLLLKEPGLGRAVAPRFLADRNRPGVGQRFYFLEFPHNDAPARPAGRGPALPGTSATRVVLDFERREIRVLVYYSEAEAQGIAAHFRRRAAPGLVLTSLKARNDAQLATAFSPSHGRALRIIHPSVPTRVLAERAIAPLLRAKGSFIAATVFRWVLETFRRELERRYDALGTGFTAAADSEADGVTLTVTFKAPPLLGPLGNAVAGAPVNLAHGTVSRAMGESSLAATPGTGA